MTSPTVRISPGLRTAGYVVLVAATVVGLWAMWATLREGHIHANTTQIVPWGLWVALYLFFIGASAGSFLLATLVYVFGLKRFEPIGPLALVQALACLLLGGLLITLDLGHPERGYKVLTSFNPTSVMSWMGLLYLAYLAILLAMVVRVLGPRRAPGPLAVVDRRWLRRLGSIGLPIGVLVLMGEGAVFAVTKAQPNWFGGLFPVLVLVSALVSAGALLTVVAAGWLQLPEAQQHALLHALVFLTLGFLSVEVLILASDLLTAFYGEVPYEVEAWRLILFGPFWWVFWFGQVGAGIVAPLVLISSAAVRRRPAGLGLVGLLVLLGMVGARMNLIIPPQIHPDFPGLAEAYHHARFAVGYFPSVNEWLVALGVAAIGVWFFLGALRLLPRHTAGEPASAA